MKHVIGDTLDTMQRAKPIDTAAMKKAKTFSQQMVKDRLRLQIIEYLWASPGATVKELMNRFSRDQPTISQELKFLRMAGVVEFRTKSTGHGKVSSNGSYHFYSLKKEAIEKIGILHELFGRKKIEDTSEIEEPEPVSEEAG